MGKVVDVRLSDVHHLITQAYLAGGPYQWAREGAVNSIQAEASWIKFGIETQGYQSQGVARRYIADNGIGMDEDELRIFLSSFGGGGRTIGVGENFGQGFKSSCYEWNPYGIVIASWTEATPEGRMIWIHRVEERGNVRWELRDFDLKYEGEEEFEDCVIPVELKEIGVDISKLKFPEIADAGQGTVFLFLGDGPGRDTEHGDYVRGEDSQRGIVSYLNSRLIDMPKGVELTVESLGARAEDSMKDVALSDPHGKRRFLSTRKVRGIRGGIRTKGTNRGRMSVAHNTTIEWYLTDEDDVTKDATYRPTRPVIAVKYDDEAYDIKHKRRDFRQFGIVDEIRDRVWLFIEPPKIVDGSPKWGVTPQASRGTLIAKGGHPLPWDDWYQEFFDNMPKEIRDAIAASRSGESRQDEAARRDRLKRVMSNLGKRFMPESLVQTERGTERGEKNAPGSDSGNDQEPRSSSRKKESLRNVERANETGTAGEAIILSPDDAGNALGARRRKANSLPAVTWDEKFTGDDRFFAARFDIREERSGSFGTIHLNAAWPIFEGQYQYWRDRYPRADQSAVDEIVRSAYEDEVVTKVMHAYKLRNKTIGMDEFEKPIRLSAQLTEELTSPVALTTAVIGLINVETKIATAIGQRFGPGRKPEADEDR